MSKKKKRNPSSRLPSDALTHTDSIKSDVRAESEKDNEQSRVFAEHLLVAGLANDSKTVHESAWSCYDAMTKKTISETSSKVQATSATAENLKRSRKYGIGKEIGGAVSVHRRLESCHTHGKIVLIP